MGDKAKLKYFQKDAADVGVTLSAASSSVGDGNKDLIKFRAYTNSNNIPSKIRGRFYPV